MTGTQRPRVEKEKKRSPRAFTLVVDDGGRNSYENKRVRLNSQTKPINLCTCIARSEPDREPDIDSFLGYLPEFVHIHPRVWHVECLKSGLIVTVSICLFILLRAITDKCSSSWTHRTRTQRTQNSPGRFCPWHEFGYFSRFMYR